MWKVAVKKKAAKELEEAPDEIQASYLTWKAIIEKDGIMAMRVIPGYRDHALSGKWEGSRAAYLNGKWRAIYATDGKNVTITVVRISPHDYRRL